MNVALVIENLFAGGAERVVCELASGLQRRGHHVFVYCLHEAGSPGYALTAGGVSVREARSVGRDPLLAWRLFRWLRHDRIDIVHAHNSASVVWTLPAARMLRVPLVQTRHGALLGHASRYRRVADACAPLLARIVIVAESLRAGIRPAATARHAVCIPNGFDLPPTPPADARAALQRLCGRRLAGPVVLNVGTICPEKDIVGLLRAFAELRRAHPTATFVCVGPERNADYVRRVRHARAVLDLNEDVIFPGPIADAWQLMAGADVFCLGSATEALPNVVVEALSQQTPLVATAVGDVGTLAPHDSRATLLRHRENALLVPPHDPAALAAALREALADPAATRRRAARGRADYEQHYTADRMVSRHVALYHEHARRRPAATAEPSPRVLMVGPAPGTVGGMTSVVDSLLAGPLRHRYELQRWWPPSAAGGPCRTPPPVRRLPRCEPLLRHTRALFSLAAATRRHRARIVHLHTCSFVSFYRSLVDLAVARLLGRRVLLHIHGAKFDEFCAAGSFLRRLLIRHGCQAADAVIVLSRHWADTLRPYVGRGRLEVVPNGVALGPSPRERPPATDRPCRFLFLGALTRRKGIAELVAAARQLHEDGTPFELVLAGPPADNEPEDWAAVLRDQRLTDAVRLVGSVGGRQKADLIASCDVLVLPSLNEGLPMALLEGAAAGLALITTPVGGIPEFLAEATGDRSPARAGFIAPLVRPGNVPELAAAMRQLATDAAQRQQVAQAVWQRVRERYSDECVAERLDEVYRSVLTPAVTAWRARWQRLEAAVVRRLTYPLHEWLRGRPTMREYHGMQRLAALSPQSLRLECAARLRALLAYCYENLPYWHERIDAFHVKRDAGRLDPELAKLPVQTKADIRANAGELVCPTARRRAQRCSSGGTTGDTLYFLVDQQRQAQDLGARLFMQALFGVAPGDRRVYLWGSPIETGKAWVHRLRDRLLNEMLLNAFTMSPAQIDQHLDTICHFQPRVIYGYTSAVTALAQRAAAQRHPTDFRWLKLAVLTGEEITPEQRRAVHDAFRCPVAAEYGNREVGLIAHECPQGRLHVMSPHIHVDIVADGCNVAAGQFGEVVCTTLNTRAQPFLRYRVGDVGRLLDEVCPCGLPFPVMRVEGGKVAGFLALPDGRLCHGAVSSHALHHLEGIVTFRTHQRRLDWIEVSLVVDARFRQDSIDIIKQRYHRLFGDRVQVDCRIVDHIPPDPSGKRRHVVSDVAPQVGRFEVVEGVTLAD